MKYCRLISFVLFVACCILFVFMNKEYDGWLVVALNALIVAGMISLIVRIRNENKPQFLAKTETGMLVLNFITPVVVTGFAIYGLVTDDHSLKSEMWIYLAILFGNIYSVSNNLILYRLKKAYDSKNQRQPEEQGKED